MELISQLQRDYADLAGREVVLYGLGRLSELLLQHRDRLDFSIIGVMDKVLTEGFFKGVLIVGPETFPWPCRTILITANTTFAALIHRRLAALEARGVEIYYPDGRRRFLDRPERAGGPWPEDTEALKQLIDRHELISFDVFDSLVFRLCLDYQSLWALLERELQRPGWAEKRSGFKGSNPSLEKIYQELSQRHGPEFSPEIMAAELALEARLLRPRRDTGLFYDYARGRGKRVVLVSDMHLGCDRLEPLLRLQGLEGYDDLLVSADLKKSKSAGDIWDEVRRRYPVRSILHLGDDPSADVYRPLEKGLKTFEIKAPAALLEDWAMSPATARRPDDKLALGLTFARLTAPALWAEGRRIISDPAELGYIFFGPLVWGFLGWLGEAAAAAGVDRLLFLARDGYLWQRLYERHRRPHWPAGEYFYASRRALAGASIFSAEDLRDCVLGFRFSHLTVGDWLRRVLGFEAGAEEEEKFCHQLAPEALAEYISKKFLGPILEHSEAERANYRLYLQSSGLAQSQRPAVVDGGTSGGGTLRLRRLSGRDLELFCLFQARPAGAPDGLQPLNIRSWLNPGLGGSLADLSIVSRNNLCETVFSSPDQMLSRFDLRGRPVFAGGSRDFALIEKCQRGIEDWAAKARAAGCETVSAEMAETIFGALFRGPFRLSETAFGPLAFYDDLTGIKENILI